MWRKATIDERAEHYLILQLEREKKEEKEEKELKAKRAEEANLNEQLKVRGWCSVSEKEDKLL